MQGKSKKSRREESSASPIIKIIIGSSAGSILYFAMLAVFATLALKSNVSSSSYMLIGNLIGALTGFISGFATVRPIKEKGAIYGGLTGLLQALICATVLFIVNKASAGSGIFIMIAVIIIAGIAGGITGVNLKTKKKY